jgi:TRAP-type mannitol/chloroaromatic compound transport system permease small subunit
MHAAELPPASLAQADETARAGPSARLAGLFLASLASATNLLNAIGSAWIFGLMCMMLADLGSRFLFNKPLSGVAEVAGLSIVGIVYLQLAATVRCGRMTRADFISDWIARKAPRFGHLLTALFQLLGCATMSLLAAVSFAPFRSAWTDNETLGTTGVFLVSTWPFRGMVLLGTTMAAVCYLTLAVREVARTLHPGAAHD